MCPQLEKYVGLVSIICEKTDKMLRESWLGEIIFPGIGRGLNGLAKVYIVVRLKDDSCQGKTLPNTI